MPWAIGSFAWSLHLSLSLQILPMILYRCTVNKTSRSNPQQTWHCFIFGSLFSRQPAQRVWVFLVFKTARGFEFLGSEVWAFKLSFRDTPWSFTSITNHSMFMSFSLIQKHLMKQISHSRIRIIVVTCPRDINIILQGCKKSCVPAKSHKSQWCEANIMSIRILAPFHFVTVLGRLYSTKTESLFRHHLCSGSLMLKSYWRQLCLKWTEHNMDTIATLRLGRCLQTNR